MSRGTDQKMKLKRQIEEDNLIITHLGGHHTYDHAIAALDELLELNKGSKEIYEIVINSDDLEIEFTQEQISLLAGKLRSVFQNFEKGASAVVANSDYVFGMSRMVQSMVDNDRIAVAAFRTEKLARLWIQEMRTLHEQSSQ